MAIPAAHSAAVAHGDEHPHGPSVAAYFAIFIALLVLLFISVAVAYIPSQGSVRDLLTLIGFSIATVKALLIMLYFMHVKFGSKLTWLFAFSSFFFLVIFVGLTMNDYGTRTPVVKDPAQLNLPVEPSGMAQGYHQERPTGNNNATKTDMTDKK